MNTYSEEEIKMWFDKKIKEYSNAPVEFHLKCVKRLMFDEDWERENLKKIKSS